MSRKGFLICFTGMDGTGKTTQAKNLVSSLNVQGVNCSYVWNTYQPFLMKLILTVVRAVLFRGKDAFQDYASYTSTKRGLFRNRILARSYIYMVLLEYLCQSFMKITAPLILGKNIVSDRYYYDTVINLAVDNDYPERQVEYLMRKISCCLPVPDITFLIDVSEETSFQRKSDIPSIEHLKMRRKIYLSIGGRSGLVTLDGTMGIKILEQIIQDKVNQVLKLVT